MTPQEFRDKKIAIVATPGSFEELTDHPLVTATPQGVVIATMALNLALEQFAQRLEQEGGPSVKELRAQGYAVALFTPEELGDALADEMEDHLVRTGNEFLEFHHG